MSKLSKINPNGRLSLKQNFSWILVGNIVFAFSQWFIISIMTKIGTSEMVGMYTLALGVTAPIFLFLNLNLRSIQATDQLGYYSFVSFFLFRNFTSVIAVIITLISLLILQYSIELSIIIFLIAINKFIESQSDVIFGYFQRIENMNLIAKSKIIKAIITMIIFGLLLYISNNLLLSIIGILISNLVILITYDLSNLHKKGVNRIFGKEIYKILKERKLLVSLFLLGLPLGAASALDSLTINSQRYVIENVLSLEQLGYYASITYLMVAGQTIVGALSHAALPRLSHLYINDFNKYIKLILKLFLIGIIIASFLIFISYNFGALILEIIYTKEYSEYSNLFILIMVCASIWYLTGFLNAALLATRRFNHQFLIYGASFLSTFILTILLIPSLGLFGAAIGLLLGMLTRLIFIVLILIKEYVSKNKSIA
ncbi:lipopolysaccharide biosynthesis protein [Salinicoccus roseus]|uniref:lipopolysaccharide biosynthesis protein n=1 Tax=Salinicoccus roseus TaxID=45670 RepID=UPI0022FFF941|nr:oligosaccharide flippase family protein [Salinicoccus roseus]